MPTNRLAERLEAERRQRDLGVREFAQGVLGIDHSLVSRYLNGRQLPGRKNQRLIIQRLKWSREEMEALLPDETDRLSTESPNGRGATLDDDRRLARAIVDEIRQEFVFLRPAELAARYGHPFGLEDEVDLRSAAGRVGGMIEEARTAKRAFYPVRIDGGCMAPRIPDGSVVYVEATEEWIIGKVHILEHDGLSLCKLVRRIENGRPIIEAEDGTTIEPNVTTRVVGVVRAVAV